MTEFMSPIMTLVINVIYKRIKDLREDNDFTQQYIADMLHISRSAYSAYENGANAIPIEVLIKLSYFYDTSVDFLLEQTDVKMPYPRRQKK